MDNKIALEILKEIYLNAIPSVNFDLIDKSEDKWYWNFSISVEKELEIIEKHLKTKRLTKLYKQMIKNTVYNLSPINI